MSFDHRPGERNQGRRRGPLELGGRSAQASGVVELPAGTVTFLFTDVEGSTRLLHELGASYADVLAEHRRVLRHAFARHGGVEVDTQGDAFFVAFARASDALAAASEAQDALNGPIRVRMGLHTGEPLLTDEGYVGMDVHRAARIAAAGHGGQIVVSKATRDRLDQAALRDLGEHRLKDLNEPEWLFQVGAGDFPPLKSLNNTNLPVPATAFVGREEALARLRDLIIGRAQRLVTVTGAGGTGKTRLALRLGLDLIDEFPNGVFFVSLAPVSGHELVVPTIARTLGVRERPGESLLESLCTELADKRMLLLLDNFEHVLDAAQAVTGVVRSARNVTILVTSRERLHLSDEHEFALDPLLSDDAVHLFTARAQAADATFELDGSRSAVAEICRRLDGLPLAIELAAARVKIFAPDAMLSRLRQRLPLLTRGARDVPERQRTLRATIEWSYGLLGPVEQRLFARLAVFVDGCRLEAAEAVSAVGLADVTGLVDKSLLRRRDDPDGEPRFWMLETIREFGLERVSPADEGQLRRDHAANYLRFAQRARREIREGSAAAVWLDRLEADHGNLRAALAWTLEQDEAEQALDLCAALWYFWLAHGHLTEGWRWCERALTAAVNVPVEKRAGCLPGAAELAGARGDWERAKGLFEESLAVGEQLGDDRRIAVAYHDIAGVEASLGDLHRARLFAERSVALRRSLGAKFGIAHALGGLGAIARRQGDFAVARAALVESIALWTEDEHHTDAAEMMAELALVAADEGEWERAEELLRESLSRISSLQFRISTAVCLVRLARIAVGRNDPLRAAKLIGAGDSMLASVDGALDPLESADRDATCASASAQLGREAFAAARAEGATLEAEAAVELALGESFAGARR